MLQICWRHKKIQRFKRRNFSDTFARTSFWEREREREPMHVYMLSPSSSSSSSTSSFSFSFSFSFSSSAFCFFASLKSVRFSSQQSMDFVKIATSTTYPLASLNLLAKKELAQSSGRRKIKLNVLEPKSGWGIIFVKIYTMYECLLRKASRFLVNHLRSATNVWHDGKPSVDHLLRRVKHVSTRKKNPIASLGKSLPLFLSLYFDKYPYLFLDRSVDRANNEV